MKCIFLGYAYGGKGHRICCTKEGNTIKFVISRDVTFEFFMCNQRGCGTSVVGKDQGDSHKVEFETKSPHIVL